MTSVLCYYFYYNNKQNMSPKIARCCEGGMFWVKIKFTSTVTDV